MNALPFLLLQPGDMAISYEISNELLPSRFTHEKSLEQPTPAQQNPTPRPAFFTAAVSKSTDTVQEANSAVVQNGR